MKSFITVRNRKEGEIIRAGLDDPMTRSLVKVMGALKPLDKEAQARTLRYLCDYYGIKL